MQKLLNTYYSLGLTDKIAVLLAASLLSLAVAGLSFLEYQDKQMVEEVKRGELALLCYFKNGKRTVEPSLILGRDGGQWVFVNGRAKSCEIKKK